ncbi:MAG TPA: ligase-associated DNA damage response endonuclease PdeM [Gemmatimonadaceae bacterium]|nr:ligase-associated DNA damage response endonuclease PdeM [Gemmatimonadaceae bacterium]
MTALDCNDAPIDVRGEIITLLPERAAFWHRTATLLVADPHWGKAATFRASGIPVPSGTTRDAVDRLASAATRTLARRIVFLGDLLHAREGRSARMFESLAEWRLSNTGLEVVLVRGNHDRRAGDPPGELKIDCVNAPYLDGPFIFTHHPIKDEHGYVIAGHVHPGITLRGPARQRERLPCFFFGSDYGILPAFGDFTGLADVEPAEGDRVYAVADRGIMQVY